ncbi:MULTISPECIES: fimbrial biogenesis chaperone [Stenotrophomonas]|uniref:fimbrial biogenesis chaperone n=1 Tax=Stenotrophomonas TaxID=40323 RepID=UPI000DA9416F|nr:MULTISPECIES: molecular chaperone [Stenotrophomonas]MBA0328023.1 molecular chaperone [Stenotrophomonas maltophilia]MBH1442950.1 molecular chaperone [Stenotrophomonas maltophilia]MBN7849964.1 molecular chaperone [Stenotrophomonas maltophilia]MCR1003512.1 molecular chaperone [Stenotrophomonas maltophilia]MCR1571599.1 molecular chaperone [Stenotrophomonas sp.]
MIRVVGTETDSGRSACARWRQIVVGAVLTVVPVAAWAQVAMDGTRVVFPASSKEVAVALTNASEVPVLVQAWIGDEDAEQAPEASSAPFLVGPPLLRLEPGQKNQLRVLQLREKAPTDDREHLYWLNVMAVPPKSGQSGENELNVMVRSRYKVLYRPAGLPKPPVDRTEGITFTLQGDGERRALKVTNATPFYFNLGRITLGDTGNEVELDNPAVPPRQAVDIAVPAEAPANPRNVRIEWIDDDGQLHPATRTLDVATRP